MQFKFLAAFTLFLVGVQAQGLAIALLLHKLDKIRDSFNAVKSLTSALSLSKLSLLKTLPTVVSSLGGVSSLLSDVLGDIPQIGDLLDSDQNIVCAALDPVLDSNEGLIGDLTDVVGQIPLLGGLLSGVTGTTQSLLTTVANGLLGVVPVCNDTSEVKVKTVQDSFAKYTNLIGSLNLPDTATNGIDLSELLKGLK